MGLRSERHLTDSDVEWLNEPISYNPLSARNLMRSRELMQQKATGRIDPEVKVVLPGKSRGTFDNVILSGGPYDPICTTTIHG